MKKRKLYVQMFSIHGLLRSENMELGRDADTGGQINYAVDLAKHLSARDDVERVDLFTRLISDKAISDTYAQPIEDVNDKFRIIRIQCGGKKYIRKELLWPHLDEYVDKTIRFIKQNSAIPDIIHGHYADAGYICMQLYKLFGIPFVFTGHSLGNAKRMKLLNDGMREEDIYKKFKTDLRINVEEEILQNADLIITSTNQEIIEQYAMYQNHSQPKYTIIPPGLDIDKFHPFYHDILPETAKNEIEMYAHATVIEELNRFFMHPGKPLALALCRPDTRKNISGLITAYGEDKELQTMANLAIFAGIRKDISLMEENEKNVLTDMLLLMDKYDLYGKMAIPKKHDFEHQVPELYRTAAEKKGVFVNAALTEPFGLTLIEASASGLPIVATNDGGPIDIIKNLKNGILINPTQTKEISNAIKKIITDNEKWHQYSRNGIVNIPKHYTWRAHTNKYLKEITGLSQLSIKTEFADSISKFSIGKRLAKLKYFLITDIDDTLIGGKNKYLEEFIQILNENHKLIGFGAATGRTIDSAVEFLKKYKLPSPDVIIASVGTELYYGNNSIYDQGWETHISNQWHREKIRKILNDIDFLTYQQESSQQKFKISFNMEHEKGRITKMHDKLLNGKYRYNIVYSQGKYLDVLPYRASKGKAIRYLSYKWEIPLENILVCGDSGNDEEMLRGEPLGIVVGNYKEELEKLRGLRNIYFAKRKYAGGIIEGIERYKFIEKAKEGL